MEERNCVGHTDVYSETDYLGGEKYYKGFASFITKCNTPMTMSVQGGWGTGKTTALHLIEKQIKNIDDGKCKTLWFNTWQYSKFSTDSNMVLSLMVNMYSKLEQESQIKGDKSSIKKMFKKTATNIVPMFVESKLGGVAAEKVKNGLESAFDLDKASDMAKDIEDFKDKLESYIKSVVGEDGRLIVFIDDIDRLEPRIAVELLESLKLFLDCKRCVFVLAVDFEVVYRGVQDKYGNSIDEKKARKFFDKIIQVPFTLPVEQYDLNHYISQFVLDLETEDVDKYKNAIIKLVGNNPRSIKRAFNLLELYELIMTELVDESTNRTVLFAIILFQEKDRDAYNKMVRAAKISVEEFKNLLQDIKYKDLVEAIELNIDDLNSEEENWDTLSGLTKLIVLTSRIISTDQTEIIDNDLTDMEDIMAIISDSYTLVTINNDYIIYYDEDENKVCALSKRYDSINVIVYDHPDEHLEILDNPNLLDKSSNKKIDQNQIGFYDNKESIVFVGVNRCNNKNLIHDILSYYKLLK